MNTKPITAEALLRDIRAHCVDCMGGQRGMVAFCTSTKCRLWPHRLPPDEAGRDSRVKVEAFRDGSAHALSWEAYGRQLSMLDKEAMA